MSDAKTESIENEQLRWSDGWPCFREHSLFESAVEESSRQQEVPREMSMMCALGAMSTVCQQYVDVEMPRGNRSPIALMLLTIADSGERKTTAQKYFFEPIIAINQKALDSNNDALREHRIQHQIWGTQKRQLERMYSKHASAGEKEAADAAIESIREHLQNEPAPEASQKFLYEDTTPQALVQFLYENAQHGCLLSSEANSIFNGKALNDLDKLNTLWDGGTLIVDRLSREPITLSGARLTLSLMTQPSVISKFMGRRGEEARGTGFLARFFVVKPKSMAGKRSSKQGVSKWPRKESFGNKLRKIMNTPAPKNRQILKFSEPAKSLWFEINKYIEKNMDEDGLYYHMKDHASKLLENTSRLAAVLHAFERDSNDDTEIDLFTLQFSWKFTQTCSRHFAKHLANEPQIVTDACELANYLLQECHKDTRNKDIIDDGLPGARERAANSTLPPHLKQGARATVTLTKIKQYGPNRLRGRANSERLQAAIELLTKIGHLKKEGPHYKFKESILLDEPPRLRNGIDITVNALPLFNDQEFVELERHVGRHEKGHYYITVSR